MKKWQVLVQIICNRRVERHGDSAGFTMHVLSIHRPGIFLHFCLAVMLHNLFISTRRKCTPNAQWDILKHFQKPFEQGAPRCCHGGGSISRYSVAVPSHARAIAQCASTSDTRARGCCKPRENASRNCPIRPARASRRLRGCTSTYIQRKA